LLSLLAWGEGQDEGQNQFFASPYSPSLRHCAFALRYVLAEKPSKTRTNPTIFTHANFLMLQHQPLATLAQ
jgi:hypothetical protein